MACGGAVLLEVMGVEQPGASAVVPLLLPPALLWLLLLSSLPAAALVFAWPMPSPPRPSTLASPPLAAELLGMLLLLLLTSLVFGLTLLVLSACALVMLVAGAVVDISSAVSIAVAEDSLLLLTSLVFGLTLLVLSACALVMLVAGAVVDISSAVSIAVAEDSSSAASIAAAADSSVAIPAAGASWSKVDGILECLLVSDAPPSLCSMLNGGAGCLIGMGCVDVVSCHGDMSRHVVRQMTLSSSTLAEYLLPFNYAVGVSGGVDFIIKNIQLGVDKYITQKENQMNYPLVP